MKQRKPKKRMPQRTCVECEDSYFPHKDYQRFCSIRCRVAFHRREIKAESALYRRTIEQGHNLPPDFRRETLVGVEIRRLINWLCWYHGIEKEHPYIESLLKAAYGENQIVESLEEFPPRNCRQCDKQFKPKRQWQWFCSPKCDKKNHEENVKIGQRHETH
jgi:hypothetical protein